LARCPVPVWCTFSLDRPASVHPQRFERDVLPLCFVTPLHFEFDVAPQRSGQPEVRESCRSSALNYFVYNFIPDHRTLRTSPAMAAGVTNKLWEVSHLVARSGRVQKSNLKESGMHAAVVKLRIDTERASVAAAAFSNDILPRVKAAAGFVGGYWLDPVDGEGLGLVLFETAEQAERVQPPGSGWSAPGVTILGVDVRRVAVAIPDRR
jgi:hypothetical protein